MSLHPLSCFTIFCGIKEKWQVLPVLLVRTKIQLTSIYPRLNSGCELSQSPNFGGSELRSDSHTWLLCNVSSWCSSNDFSPFSLSSLSSFPTPGTSSSRQVQAPPLSSPQRLRATLWQPAQCTRLPPGRCRGIPFPAPPSSSRSPPNTAHGGEMEMEIFTFSATQAWFIRSVFRYLCDYYSFHTS